MVRTWVANYFKTVMVLDVLASWRIVHVWPRTVPYDASWNVNKQLHTKLRMESKLLLWPLRVERFKSVAPLTTANGAVGCGQVCSVAFVNTTNCDQHHTVVHCQVFDSTWCGGRSMRQSIDAITLICVYKGVFQDIKKNKKTKTNWE